MQAPQNTQTTTQPTPADWLPTTRPDGFNHPISPEPRDPEFHAFRESLFAEFAPQTCYEFDLVEDIIHQRWGLKLNQRREADLIAGNRAMARYDFDRVMNEPKSADFPELRKIAEIADEARGRIRTFRGREREDLPAYQAALQTIEFCLDEYLRLSGNPSPVSAREIRSRESQLRRSLSATLSELRRTRRERCHHIAGEQHRWKEAKNKEFFEAKAKAARETVADCETLAPDSAISLPVSATNEPELVQEVIAAESQAPTGSVAPKPAADEPSPSRTDAGRPRVVAQPQIQQVTFGPNGSRIVLPNENGRT